MKKQGRVDFRMNQKSKRLIDGMAKALGFINSSRFVAFAITDKVISINDSEAKKTRIGVVVSNSASNRSQLRKIFESKVKAHANYEKLVVMLDEIDKTLRKELLTSAQKFSKTFSALEYSNEFADLYAQFQVSVYEKSDYTRVKYIGTDYNSFEQFKADFKLDRIALESVRDLKLHQYFCRRLLHLSVETIILKEDDFFLDKISDLFMSVNNTLELYSTNLKIGQDTTEALSLLRNKTIEIYRTCEDKNKNKESNVNNTSAAEI